MGVDLIVATYLAMLVQSAKKVESQYLESQKTAIGGVKHVPSNFAVYASGSAEFLNRLGQNIARPVQIKAGLDRPFFAARNLANRRLFMTEILLRATIPDPGRHHLIKIRNPSNPTCPLAAELQRAACDDVLWAAACAPFEAPRDGHDQTAFAATREQFLGSIDRFMTGNALGSFLTDLARTFGT